jgi:hypothetical protein
MSRALQFSRFSPVLNIHLCLCNSTNYRYVQDLPVMDGEPVLNPVRVASLREDTSLFENLFTENGRRFNVVERGCLIFACREAGRI